MPPYAIVERPDRDLLGEGPLWSARENALYWVDIKAPRINRLDLASGAVRTWSMPEAIGWLIERRGTSGGFVAGLKSGFAALTLDPLMIDRFGDPEAHLPDTRMNDAKADRLGRVWAGSMDERGEAQPIGALRRLDPDFTWREVDTGYHIANGPTFSPDQSVLYHADSARQVVYAYDVEDGALTNKREFVRFEGDMGYPDGMTTDAEGGIWIAAWDGGRVNRFTPEGQLDRLIALPASQITSCAFVGPDLDRLFVTSAAMGRDDEPHAGALFEVDAGVRGLPPGQFGG